MKFKMCLLLCAIPLLALSGCNQAAVKNPPRFVEMYLHEEQSSISQQHSRIQTPKLVQTEHDGQVFSHQDFFIAIITNGTNYDLLYSVELVDSLLGTCIYTNQSLQYKADATITVESNSTYTTEVLLTIPGSTSHTSYLSERTITLTKILFSRDNVNGTFAAEIPSNTNTELSFEVHATNYMDAELGFPVVMNNGFIDVLLRPTSSEFSLAQTRAKTDITIPATINGYLVRSIFIESLSWVVNLTIEGANNNVYIIGTFNNLTSLIISGLTHQLEMINPSFKELSITAHFPLLTSISISECSGYRLYLKHNTYSQNADYLSYCQNAVGAPYSFPMLTTLSIEASMFGDIVIGDDIHNVAFSSLSNIYFDEVYVGYLKLGNDDNEFVSLVTVSAVDSQFSTMLLAGNRGSSITPARLLLTDGSYGQVEIKGNLWGDINFIDVTLGGLLVSSVISGVSPMTSLSLTNITFNGTNPGLQLSGSYPLLETITLDGITGGFIVLGGVHSNFNVLTSITANNITGQSFHVGDRSSKFQSLEIVSITNSTFVNSVRFGYESSEFAALETIYLSNVSALSVLIGWYEDVFSALKLVHLTGVTLGYTFTIQSVTAILLDAIVCQNVTMQTLNITVICPGYDFYFDTVTISSSLYLTDSCDTIYVTENPASTWAYYARAGELEIPVLTGTYSPS